MWLKTVTSILFAFLCTIFVGDDKKCGSKCFSWYDPNNRKNQIYWIQFIKKKKKRFFVQEHKKIVPKSTLLRVACKYKINVMKSENCVIYTPQIIIHIQMALSHFSWKNDLPHLKLKF